MSSEEGIEYFASLINGDDPFCPLYTNFTKKHTNMIGKQIRDFDIEKLSFFIKKIKKLREALKQFIISLKKDFPTADNLHAVDMIHFVTETDEEKRIEYLKIRYAEHLEYIKSEQLIHDNLGICLKIVNEYYLKHFTF